MNNLQNLKEKSVDISQNPNLKIPFSIQLDVGNLYVPGQMVCTEEHRVVFCRSNCDTIFTAGGIQYPLKRGDMLLIKPNVPHGVVAYTKNEEKYGGFLVTVKNEYMDYLTNEIGTKVEFIGSSKLIHTRGTVWENIDSLFILSLEESELKAYGADIALFGLSLALLVNIARAVANDPGIAVNMDKPDLLTAILAYVENNLAEKITLENMANRFFVSTSTITHLFNKKMNISFYKYVTTYRLWRAQNLIKEGVPMEKIAAQVGFGDYSAFYRAFKQEYNISPRQFYKEFQENNSERNN